MTLREIIRQTRELSDQFNPPAGDRDLAKLRSLSDRIPDDVVELYRDHNGSAATPIVHDRPLPARLMPVEEVLETEKMIGSVDWPKLGTVVWLWTDDNSNYCGVYTDGPVAGWLTVLDHEQPILVPAFRSVAAFVAAVLQEAKKEEEEDPAIDLPYIPREIPVTSPDPANYEADRRLAERFSRLFDAERDEDLRRLYADCAICLTPFENTDDVLRFLEVDDMWIPSAAVTLLGVRHWEGGVSQLERLAREGSINGDSDAMCHLYRMGTTESQKAIARLRKELKGQKRQMLEQWSRGSLPPRWP